MAWFNDQRHGKEPIISDLGSVKFTDPIWADGKTLGQTTFDELSAATWTNDSKSASPSWSNDSKNSAPSWTNDSKS